MNKQSAIAVIDPKALYVMYRGKYNYASVVVTVSTPTAMTIGLGVSDTDLATAASAAQTAVTGTSALTMKEVVAGINSWYDTTAAREVQEGEWLCKPLHCRENDAFYHASTALFIADAGTTYNYKGIWRECCAWHSDNTGVGHVTLRIPHPAHSRNNVALRLITGVTGTSGTPTLTRTITDGAGTTTHYTSAAVATATSALMEKDFLDFITFPGPVVARDSAANVTHASSTTLQALYGFPEASDS